MRNLAFTLIIAALLAAPALPAFAEVHRIPADQPQSSVHLIEQTDQGMIFRVTVGDLVAMDVETPEGTFSRLLLPGGHASQELGRPQLPKMNRLFEVPFGAEVEVEILGYEEQTIRLADYGIQHPLMPAQPSLSKSADPAAVTLAFDQAFYAQGGVYEPAPAQAVETGRLRGLRIGRIETAPVSYDMDAGTITVRNNLEIAVRFLGADFEADQELKARTYSPYFEVVYNQIAGYRGLHDQHPDLMDGSVTYAVVSDPMFEAQLQPFIQWKTAQGFKVIEGYTGDPGIGTTTTSIRSYLHGLYNNPPAGYDPPTFVLLVGDVEQIPAFNLSGYSDLPYCDTTGDDVPEMYYGRFSAQNPAQLQPQIDKTLEYEQHLFPDPSYLGEVVMIAGVDSYYAQSHGNGQINYGTTHYFNAAHGILSHTYLYPASGSSGPQIIQNVSDGVAYINYTAHGSQTSWSNPSFTLTNVANLQNEHEYCLAVGNCCLTSSFQVSTCFAEQWLRVANKGAIGYIGASESTYWDEDYYWGVGYGPVISGGATYEQTGLGTYDGMFHDHGEGIGQWYVAQGAHVFCGNLAVQESGSGLTDYYWEIYNLMGDPSLSVYFGVPDANAVVLPPSIIPSATAVEVRAEPNSYVGFSAAGVYLGGGLIGESGTAMIPISGLESVSSVHVVVTCQNKIPYTADVPVAVLEGPYLVFDHNVILDADGDNDGALDAGESIDLITYLKNIGNQTATSVTGVLSEIRGVTITDGNETWGAIVPEQIKPCNDSFKLTVSSDTPDQTEVSFTLEITCDQDAWEREFSMMVEAPVLGLVSVEIDDTAGGDGDGVAEPGETVELTFLLGNTGHEDAVNVQGQLTCYSGLGQVVQGSASVGSVPEGGQAMIGPFELAVSPACPEMNSLDLRLVLTADLGQQAQFDWMLPVAPWIDDFQADHGWTVSGDATSGVWERADPEGTTYGGQQVQPEDDHTPAPGTLCFVTGPLAGSSAGSYDVDGGATILTSPVFDLSGHQSATVEYWRWYTNNLGNAPGEDWWSVEVSSNGGAGWTYLEHTQESDNSWTRFSFALEDYITLSSQVVFRFTAEDAGSGSLVEGLVDDFMLYGRSEDLTDVDESGFAGGMHLGQNRPNPFNPRTEILYRLSDAAPTSLRVYDASGRLVRTLVDDLRNAGEHRVTWDGRSDQGHEAATGVYFYVLRSGSERESREMILLK